MTASNAITPARSRERLIRRGTLDLSVLRRIVNAHRITILLAMTLGGIVGAVYLHLAPQRYAVRLDIMAASPSSPAGGALSALSSLAGISLGSGEDPKFREFLAALRSPVAAEAIIGNQTILRAMFPREWAVRYEKWRAPHGVFHGALNFVKRALGIPVVPWAPPNIARVYEFLRDHLKVIPDAKSGIVTLELDSPRPQDAKVLLVTLNSAIDNSMRQHDLVHATTDVDYLSRQLAKATVEELRRALASNLADQEKARMLASAPLPYVSDMLGAPTVSSKPAYPRPIPVLIGGILLGALIGFVVAARKYGSR